MSRLSRLSLGPLQRLEDRLVPKVEEGIVVVKRHARCHRGAGGGLWVRVDC